jgi:hypothetical protein
MANASSSMASWVGNMIIFVVGCGIGLHMLWKCQQHFPLCFWCRLIRSIFCEAILSYPFCKGGPTSFTTLPLVLGVGYTICCGSLILWALIACPWTSISIPWCSGEGLCGICFTLGKLFTTLVFRIVVQSTSHSRMTLAYTIWQNHKQASLFRKCVGWPQKKSQNSTIFDLKPRCWHKDQEVALYVIIGASLEASQCRPM